VYVHGDALAATRPAHKALQGIHDQVAMKSIDICMGVSTFFCQWRKEDELTVTHRSFCYG
jgi:hypothetical protein